MSFFSLLVTLISESSNNRKHSNIIKEGGILNFLKKIVNTSLLFKESKVVRLYKKKSS